MTKSADAASALAGLLLAACTLQAQTVFIPSDYFPARFEFRELATVVADEEIDSVPAIGRLKEGSFFLEAGAQAYARREYGLEDRTALAIEILTLEDERGAYSLVSVLRPAALAAGPPGDYMAESAGELCFAQSRYFVRIRSRAPADLLRRIATSIGNRIGRHAQAPPSLVTHLPESGCANASIRYFMGPRSAEAFSQPIAGRRPVFADPAEIVQAPYLLDGRSGLLTLISFPTMQMADDYYERSMDWLGRAAPPARLYSAKAGPIIGILEGNFDPGNADKVLGSLQYSYTVKWIYDKYKNAPTIWGLPYGIMSTVVRSIVLVSLLCLASIVAGAALAFFRVALRTYAPNNFLDRPERTELIRLKLDED